MTLDVDEFCARFDVDPAYVVVTNTGIRLRDVPTVEADRIIVALLASGLITSYEDDTLDDDGWEP